MAIFLSPWTSWRCEQVHYCGERSYSSRLFSCIERSIVPYSQLTPCAKWTYNVHYSRIYKEHRNLGIRKHVTTSYSGTKPFY